MFSIAFKTGADVPFVIDQWAGVGDLAQRAAAGTNVAQPLNVTSPWAGCVHRLPLSVVGASEAVEHRLLPDPKLLLQVLDDLWLGFDEVVCLGLVVA